MLSHILDFLIEKNWTCEGNSLTKVICYNPITNLQETKYFLGSDWSDTFTVHDVDGIDLNFTSETFALYGV